MNRLSRRDFLLAATTFTVAVACNAPTTEQSSNDRPAGGFVALEWVYVEDLLALGIQPSGVADIKGYQNYVNIPVKLAQNVTDVGTRQEPSLEAIAKLKPQMIFGTKLRHEPIYDTLTSIAPTNLFNPYPEPGEDQLQEMEQTFLAIADATKTRDKGENVLKQMRETFDRAAETLKAAGATDRPILLGQFVGNAPQLRLFTDNSMAMRILAKMGLKNAWNGKFDRYGFNTVWVEALPAVKKANFLYVAEENDTDFQQLQNNPIWKGLEFVKENRVFPLGSETWLFGGPLSAQVLVEKVVAALGKKQ